MTKPIRIIFKKKSPESSKTGEAPPKIKDLKTILL